MKHLDAFGKFQSISRWTGLAAAALFALTIAGCGGDDGADGKDGAPGKDADTGQIQDLQDQINAITKAVDPETCVTCHTGANSVARTGPDHQTIYKDFFQDGVAKVSNLAFNVVGTTATLTFKLTKTIDGVAQPIDCTQSTSGLTAQFAIGSYWAQYDPVTKTWPANQSLSGNKQYLGNGDCKFTQTGITAAKAAAMASGSGIVQLYGMDELVARGGAGNGLRLGKYPFAAVYKIGNNVDYSSAANVSGCENCHTKPYLKHTYIYGTVTDQFNQPTDFYTCKGCHYDDRNGGHQDWQILKDDPARYADLVNNPMTAAERAKYAYKAKLMNDVHMSHAMEFAYPQGMNNCITCHADKNDPTKVNADVVADNKFKLETCKSCHAVEKLIEKLPTTGTDHSSLFAAIRDPSQPEPQCGNCHAVNAPQFRGPTFAQIHNGGYNPLIYSSTGVRYSDTFLVNVDSASVAGNMLTVKFSATGSAAGLSANDISPMLLVGLYGYDSKDFIVQAHGRDANRVRLLEFTPGDTNPRFTVVSAANGSWEIKVDLSMWSDKIAWTANQIADRPIRRAEIAVLPRLTNAGDNVLGLNAASKTFNFPQNSFEDFFKKENPVHTANETIVDVAKGCNTCHAQLATTFHNGTRGGNIVVCRICHEVSSPGSHLELQSRSIDSYVHAIHQFQAFDPGDIDFNDPEQVLAYQHHINATFPRFGVLNCEACHLSTSAGGSTPGTPNVPNQANSMPGILSATDSVAGRNIGDLPRTVTGPAVRACGACHRAQAINADDAGKLAIINQHWKLFGYSVAAADNAEATSIWESVVAKIMGIFKFK
jgi:hypothetical protein